MSGASANSAEERDLALGAHKLPALIRGPGETAERNLDSLGKNEPAVCLCINEGWWLVDCKQHYSQLVEGD